ncbi:hypothetical protein CT0861_12700 [Colletotrichum tofieldiae]|uniref:Uncharacterized protein n=1 Tax=Colletotrichum tofieldiae TaxID=708197 RepID=A0A161WGY2_9PEZI|nr:hypothetical protein CT0861_12700 [Colletotrichum tofieldiae]
MLPRQFSSMINHACDDDDDDDEDDDDANARPSRFPPRAWKPVEMKDNLGPDYRSLCHRRIFCQPVQERDASHEANGERQSPNAAWPSKAQQANIQANSPPYTLFFKLGTAKPLATAKRTFTLAKLSSPRHYQH